ncbi:halocyanin domain-containing protein [Halorientalis pallida]|uniref:Halocyanin domain-containing protein n=1 Tax=Halorientalis pallida TaxID=2479928 RepID=A0A498KST3_9EURY|nr:halocyanin domain-containing protein [Halorientalis pallida]RXK46980.1 halocyanin domain-containing protein [Halorientalis pallida]
MDETTRRWLLRAVGAGVVAGTAGCSASSGSAAGSDVPTVPGSEYPTIDEWLSTSDVGGPATNYHGELLDWTDRDTVTISVGADGNEGNFAYGPPAVVVSTGTVVEWSWTGLGNPHDVAAHPTDQLGASDYTFDSGGLKDGSGVKFTTTMDQQGSALYHCTPHLSLGMKGGIVVE